MDDGSASPAPAAEAPGLAARLLGDRGRSRTEPDLARSQAWSSSSSTMRRFSISGMEPIPRRTLRRASSSLQQLRRASSCVMPGAAGAICHCALEDLSPVSPASTNDGGLRKRLSSFAPASEQASTAGAAGGAGHGAGGFWPVAALCMVMSVLSTVPYNMVLASDPGSPLFISFVLHIFVVVVNFSQVGVLLRGERKLPLIYHAGFTVLGFLFNLLKSDAFARLPTSLCMLLMNLQLLVGMMVQRVALAKRYSWSQLAGCATVTAGVAWAARARAAAAQTAQTAAPTELPAAELALGISELLGALLALTLLSLLVKVAFSQHGEAVSEQLFVQHLCGLPLFLLGGQRRQVATRLADWGLGRDWGRMALLLCNLTFTFGERKLSTVVAGRAPNLIVSQLVITVNKFLCMLVSTLLAAPPWPSFGFWGGALLLVAGTVQYLSASDAADEKSDD